MEARTKAGVKSWLEEQRLRKWRWAGHTSRREDGRWSTALLDWQPDGKRAKRGKPKGRWEDERKQHVERTHGLKGDEWRFLAACMDGWEREGDNFSRAAAEDQGEEERPTRRDETGED